MIEVDGKILKQMLAAGAGCLSVNKKVINELNVFPVPDGDTGTNMEFTMTGAIRGAENAMTEKLADVAKGMAKGALLGARGNSGVILSQFIKGLSISLAEGETADVGRFARGFLTGVEYAYKAVLKPTEGTILTVIREASTYAVDKTKTREIADFLDNFQKEARRSLQRTPDLLPVLKKAGVVDSGAAGLICITEGFLKVALGESVEQFVSAAEATNVITSNNFGPNSELEYGYCTEFILQLMNAKTDISAFDIKTMTDFLETVGDSIVAIKELDIVKVHVHTKTPEKVIEFSRNFGEFVTFKMENMSVQHSESEVSKAAITEDRYEKKPIAVVCVCCGDGLSKTFREMGADSIINGGQTMNPSSEDFVEAFKKLNADSIIVLPNNSNIYLAARQAAQLYTNAEVFVVNTHTIAEGYAAMTMLDTSSGDVQAIINDLELAAKHVITLSVTYAVRDGNIDGIDFEKGDYICVSGKNMLSANKDKVKTATQAISAVEDRDDCEIISVIHGAGVAENEKKSLISQIKTEFPYMEVFEIDGGQDVYSFIIALE